MGKQAIHRSSFPSVRDLVIKIPGLHQLVDQPLPHFIRTKPADQGQREQGYKRLLRRVRTKLLTDQVSGRDPFNLRH
jgi:hypothetical protein